MLLSALKKYFLVGIVYLIVNILLFIFWWVVTDPGNYIWNDIEDDKAHIIISACNKLFFIRYYVSLVLINSFLTAFIFIETKRNLSIGIVLFAIAFHFLSSFLFNPFIGRNYYAIFENQNVSKNFFLEPVLDAGTSICPFLFKKLNETPSFTREQAARGLGILAYEPASNTLNDILKDTTESTYMRAECYYALKKINTVQARSFLEDFSVQQNTNAIDTSLVKRIDYLEIQDVY